MGLQGIVLGNTVRCEFDVRNFFVYCTNNSTRWNLAVNFLSFRRCQTCCIDVEYFSRFSTRVASDSSHISVYCIDRRFWRNETSIVDSIFVSVVSSEVIVSHRGLLLIDTIMFIRSNEQACPINSWWTTLLESLQITSNMVGLTCSMLFLLIVFAYQELRRNLSLLLAVNLSFGGSLFCIPMLAQNIYMLLGCASDSLCEFRGYSIMVGVAYIYQSAFLQTLQRLFLTVFVHNHRLQNKWLFFGLVLAQLMISFLVLLPMLFQKKFVYQPVSKICFMDVSDVFAVMYPTVTFYLILLTGQSICSYWILQYVSRESQATQDPINAARRIRKERRVLVRLALPVILLLCAGVIYLSFFLLSMITHAQWQIPPYGLHLNFLSSASAINFTMVANLLMHNQVKKKIIEIFTERVNVSRNHSVHPTAVQHLQRTLAPVGY